MNRILIFALLCIFCIIPAMADKYSNEQCPALLLDESKGLLSVSGVQWNFEKTGNSYEPVYKNVTINPEKVKDVYYWSESFPPEWLAAHGMLAFVMEDMDSVVAADGSRDIGIVVSIEARLKEGESYSLMQGMKKDGFHIVYQLVAYTCRIQKSIAMRNHPLDQYKLHLSQEQKVALLKNSLMDSVKNRDEEMYHTLNNSCVSNACRLINTVLPEKKQMRLWLIKNRIPNLRVSYPKFTAGYICSKKIASKKEKEKLTREMGTISFDIAGQDPYVITIDALPGFRGIRGFFVSFEEQLSEYLVYAADLNTLAGIQVERSSDVYNEHQQQISELAVITLKTQQRLIDAFELDFENNLRFYLKQKPAPEITHALDESLLRKVDFMRLNESSEFLDKAAKALQKRLK